MPTASNATCDQMSSHMVQLMPASEGAKEVGAKIATVLQERCTADAWSAQARQCLFDVKDLKEADTCKQYLTKAQVDAADRQMDAQLGGQGGPPPQPSVVTDSPPPPPPPAKTRGGDKKEKQKGKSSGDPCMGGE